MNILQLKKFIPVLIIFAFSLPAILPLFHQGLFTMHDDQQVVRLIQLDKSLAAGQFPVRWVQDLGFGYGYPLFNFYPPLVYYLGEIFHLLLSTSFIISIKLVFAAAFLGSALTMYWWAKHHYGRLAAVIAALFYVYIPYRAVDAYVRGALAELFSFVWLPLILLSIDKIFDHFSNAKSKSLPFKPVVILAISYGLLMITHNLITLPFTLLMILYALLQFIRVKPKRYLQLVGSFLLAGVLGLGLSAFFWLPALSEKQFTLVDQILLTEKYAYTLHYVYPEQLWNTLWGYGGSAPGKLDGISFKIGKLHLILSLITICLCLLKVIRKGSKSKGYLILNTGYLILISGFLLLSFSAFMTTQYSSYIWDHFPPLQYLQFPWRFLEFTALFSSILSGGCIYLISQKFTHTGLRWVFSAILIMLLLLPNVKLFRPQFYLKVTDDHYRSDEFTKWEISKTSFEFMPKGVALHLDPVAGITQVDIQKDQIATDDYQLQSGSAKVTKSFLTPNLKILNLDVTSPVTVRFNTAHFPGWLLLQDHKPIIIDDQNPLKLITATLMPGKHTLTLVFADTAIRTLANDLSLFALICLAIIILKVKLLPYDRRAR